MYRFTYLSTSALFIAPCRRRCYFISTKPLSGRFKDSIISEQPDSSPFRPRLCRKAGLSTFTTKDQPSPAHPANPANPANPARLTSISHFPLTKPPQRAQCAIGVVRPLARPLLPVLSIAYPTSCRL